MEEINMWKCKNCAEMNPDSSQYCQSCGNRNASSLASQDADKWKAFDERKKAEQKELEIKRKFIYSKMSTMNTTMITATMNMATGIIIIGKL